MYDEGSNETPLTFRAEAGNFPHQLCYIISSLLHVFSLDDVKVETLAMSFCRRFYHLI
jgi:hypothetical protein